LPLILKKISNPFWGSVESALLRLPEEERKLMMDKLMLSWFNFSDQQANAECEEFVLGAIRSGKDGRFLLLQNDLLLMDNEMNNFVRHNVFSDAAYFPAQIA